MNFFDKYITENYNRITEKFKTLDYKVNEKGNSSMDICHDTLLNLYSEQDKFSTYAEFERHANLKFTPKKNR